MSSPQPRPVALLVSARIPQCVRLRTLFPPASPNASSCGTCPPALPPPGEYRLTLDLTDADTGVTADLSDVPLTVPEFAGEPVSQTPPPFDAPPDDTEPALITFAALTIQPEGVPSASVRVAVEVANFSAPVTGATLTFEVRRNGPLVDNAVIAEGVQLVDGVTSLSASYAPEGGFGPGQWTFQIVLESVDATGVATLIADSGIVHTLDVP